MQAQLSQLKAPMMSGSVIAGLSRSVIRHCSLNNIHYASRLPREQLDDLVEQAVSQVSGGCGVWGPQLYLFYKAYHKLDCVVC